MEVIMLYGLMVLLFLFGGLVTGDPLYFVALGLVCIAWEMSIEK